MAEEFFTQYFIVEENSKKNGPHDAMSMVRKIRNGKIQADTMVYVGDAYSAVPAIELPEFTVFFNSAADTDAARSALPTEPLNITELLRDAWQFYASNQPLSLFAGALSVGGIILCLLISLMLPPVLTAAFSSVIAGILLFVFLVCVARVVSGREVDKPFLVDMVKHRGIDLGACALLTAGVLFGIPAMIGTFSTAAGLFFALIGIAVFTLFIFAPLFIINDPTMHFQQALEMSKEWVLTQSTGDKLVIFGLLVVNMFAVMVFFVPLFVSLPVTFIALSDLFIHRINR